MATINQESPFVKALAANDRPTRDKAVDQLRIFLSGRRELGQAELLKLWKGLYFCMWMSDRPLTQQRLASSLADLVNALPAENIVPFLDAFWTTMAREWPNISALRIDKFMLLVRCYIAATFQRLSNMCWDPSTVAKVVELLSSVPLSPLDPKIPNGLRYHVIDVYIDEVDKINMSSNFPMPVESILLPLQNLKESSITKSVIQRVTEALQDQRILAWEERSCRE